MSIYSGSSTGSDVQPFAKKQVNPRNRLSRLLALVSTELTTMVRLTVMALTAWWPAASSSLLSAWTWWMALLSKLSSSETSLERALYCRDCRHIVTQGYALAGGSTWASRAGRRFSQYMRIVHQPQEQVRSLVASSFRLEYVFNYAFRKG